MCTRIGRGKREEAGQWSSSELMAGCWGTSEKGSYGASGGLRFGEVKLDSLADLEKRGPAQEVK